MTPLIVIFVASLAFATAHLIRHPDHALPYALGVVVVVLWGAVRREWRR